MSKDPHSGVNGPGDTGTGANGAHNEASEWWDQPDPDSSTSDSTTDSGSTAAFSAVETEPVNEGTNGADDAADAAEPREEEELADDSDKEDSKSKGPGNIWAWIGLAAVLVVLFPVVVFGVAYVSTDVPEPDELVNDQISFVFDNTGEKEITRIVPEAGNRRNVQIEEVPDEVRNAVLAAEDREFYTNPGFSLSGYGRAAWGVITGNASAGGGSTITQQYVKNAVVGNERTITRKAKEFVMSAKMAREWSKDEILEAYLNTIYFGRNAYGIAAASDAYFGKPVNELTAGEAAVLAATIQRPSALDPWTNRPEAEQRWNYVLDGMVQMNVLPQAERAQLTYPDTLDPAKVSEVAPEPGPEAMIKNQVLAELEAEGISEQDVNTRGLRITTTIDPTVQEATLDAVESWVDQSTGLRTAIVSVDPRDGAVLGYYGGDDPNGWDYANSGLQTGSTFKIFALAAALDQGIPLSKYYSSAPVQSGAATIQNSGGMSCGSCPISEALRQSLNTPFIRLQRDLKNGPDDTAAMAHKLGVAKSIPGIEKTLMEDNGHSQDGITLGQYLTRPLDMAVGLATLANDGVYHKTHFVKKVETVDGDVLLERKDEKGDRRVSKAVATNVIDAMKPIASRNSHALAGGRMSAAKTGTSQLGDTGQNKDAWMIGATPQLSTAVWVGNVDGSALYNRWGGNMFGSHTPSDLWKSVMDDSLANEDWIPFSDPEAIGGVAGAPSWSGSGSSGGEGAQTTQQSTQQYTPEATTEETTVIEEAPVEPVVPEIPPIEIPEPPAPPADGGGGGAPPIPPALEDLFGGGA